MIRRTHLLVLFVVLALVPPGASAQAATGTPPFGSFAGGSFDTVNLANLNVQMAIPIVHKPGRDLSFDYAMAYNSSIWVPTVVGSSTTWQPVNTNWGWTAQSEALTGSVPILNSTLSCFVTNPDSGLRTKVPYPVTIYSGYKDPNGTFHNAFIMTTPGYANCDDGPVPPVTSGSQAAVDGSGYLLTVNEQANPRIVVLNRGGWSIPSPGSSTGTAIDQNGNKLTTAVSGTTTTFTDTLGTSVLAVNQASSSTTTYSYTSAAGTTAQITFNYTQKTVQTAFGCGGISEYPATPVYLVTSIGLPNSTSYTITYEQTHGAATGVVTGRIASIKLPTGGAISYQYSPTAGVNGITCGDGSASYLARTTPDGTWTYNQSGGTTTVTDPTTPTANVTTVYFKGIYEIERLIYQGGAVPANLLRTIDTCYNGSSSPCASTSITLPITQRMITETLAGTSNLQCKHVYKYNSNGSMTEQDDYDYGSGAPPASPLRKTLITYATLANNILDRPSSVVVQNGSGTPQSRQDTAYDQSTSFTGANCITGAAQHDDAGHGCSFLVRGNPISVTTYTDPVTPSGAITKNFTYDSLGNLRTAQLNCCQLKTWNYSATTQYAYPDSVVSGSGTTQLTDSATYSNNSGVVLTTTDPNNLLTTVTYDNMGRALTAKVGTNPTINYTYHDYDNSTTFTPWTAQVCTPVQGTNTVCQKSIMDGLGRAVTQQTLDGSGTLYSATDVQYDAFGRAYKASNPYSSGSGSYWTTTLFDAMGRVSSAQLPAPDSSRTSYSYTDATATITDPPGKLRKMQADALGRLISVWEPDPANSNSLTLQTTYAYNALDALTTVTQGAQTRTYAFDALGRVTRTTTPEAGVVCFGSMTGSTCNPDGYDSFNNLVKRTDARGVLTTYGYDSLNRLSTVSYNVGTSGVPATPGITLTYGGTPAQFNNGRLITMTDGVGSENYTYNNLGEMTQLQKLIGSTTYTTGYQYNLAGELTQITYPSGRAVQQNVDTIGRLASVVGTLNSVNTTYASGFAYNSAFQATGFQYGNNVFASFGFSPDRLQLNCLDYSTTNRGATCAHDGTTKFGLNYSYGTAGSNNGQIAGITDSVDSGRNVNFTYDALYRLTRAVTTGSTGYPAWGLSEAYDRYGNRSTQSIYSGCVPPMSCPTNSVSPDTATNRISGDCYDLNGNLQAESAPPCPSPTYSYDAENRLLTYATAAAYNYDGNGLRVKKCLPNCSSPTTTTVYLFSGSKVIAEYVNGAAPAAPTREYIYSGAALLAKIESGATKYYHSDHLSNRLVTDSTGTAVAQLGHYPFGESWYNASNDKLQFTSYERDSESGNDYAMLRFNVNRLGRFSSPDLLSGSVGSPQSLNRYSYVRNDPGNLVDLSGLHAIPYQVADASTAGSWNQWLFEVFLNGQSAAPGDSWDFWSPVSGDIFGALIFGTNPITDLGGGGSQCPLCGPLRQPPPPHDPCDPMMIGAFNQIWDKTIRFPLMQREAYFALQNGQGGLSFVYGTGPTVRPGPGVVPHAGVPVDANTVVIAHSHPSGLGNPSEADRKSPVPNYVVSQFSLYVTDPNNPKPGGDRQVRGSDWGGPCP